MIEENGIEYKIFTSTFFFIKMAGFWIPTRMKHPCWQLCYRLYTVFSSISISSMIFGVLAYVAFSRDIFASLLENWCLAGIVCNTLYGGLNVMIKRKKIIKLLRAKITADCWTNLRDSKEVKIIAISNRAEQSMLRWWMTAIAANCFMGAINPIISNNPDNNLMFNSWLPCDRREPFCFWICWSHQVLSYALGSMIHVSSDCLIFNLIERVCSHVQILQHRLARLPDLVISGVVDTAEKEKLYITECIQSHQNIYFSAREISKIFKAIVCLHFILIFSILCTSIYLLSMQPLFSNSFISVCIFLCCLLAQSLIHCWYGYKLSQIGDDISYTIFSMDWLQLRRDTVKTLRFVMLFVSKSIPLFNNFIVELSPEMYLKMLKVSYSTFNLLHSQQ